MVGVPDAGIKGTAIYLDVEGIPDRNFCSQALGCEVSWGLIIHGDSHIDQRVNTIPLIGEVRKLVRELAALLALKASALR